MALYVADFFERRLPLSVEVLEEPFTSVLAWLEIGGGALPEGWHGVQRFVVGARDGNVCCREEGRSSERGGGLENEGAC